MNNHNEKTLKIEAIRRYNEQTYEDFSYWLRGLSFGQRFMISKHLRLGVFNLIEDPILKLSYLPSKLTYTNDLGHEYFFELKILPSEDKKIVISYKLVLCCENELVGGLTSAWVNPLVCRTSDNLFEVVVDMDSKSFSNGLVELMEEINKIKDKLNL